MLLFSFVSSVYSSRLAQTICIIANYTKRSGLFSSQGGKPSELHKYFETEMKGMGLNLKVILLCFVFSEKGSLCPQEK